jgi:hypothetical protein
MQERKQTNPFDPIRRWADTSQALKRIYVNIFDLIDHKRNPRIELRRFKSYGEFKRYTQAGRVFPKGLAKQGGLVKVLLRII